MGYAHLRSTYPKYAGIADDGEFLNAVHQGEFKTASEESFAQAASQIEKEGSGGTTTGNASPPAPSSLPGKVAGVAKKALDLGAGFVKDTVKSMTDIPQGLVVDPLKQVFQNRAATPEEEKRSLSGLAGLTGLVTAPGITEAAGMGMAKLGGPKLLQKLLAGAGAGALLGGGDAAIRSGGQASAIPGGAAGGALVGGALGSVLPGHKPRLETPVDAPMNLKSQVARSPVGPAISSVTDRMRAMGPAGQAVDDMIENVVRQSQEQPGNHLQPFDEALHKVTGRKGKLAPEARRSLLAAFQGRMDPKALPENLQPLYQQAKGYFSGTVERGTKLGATVQRGDKRVPLAQAAIDHYYPQRAVTLDALKSDSDLRSAIVQNLEDQGLAKSPAEAQAILDDHIEHVESKGKRGGQLAITAMKGLNPDMSPEQLKHALLYSQPSIRTLGGGLEHARTVNSPFYEPRPEVAFPAHVVETEHALAEIEHYGQDAGKLTGKTLELPQEHQAEMKHLIRTATESHAPWDPRLTRFLGKLRTAQLGLFTPTGTTVKNVSQRGNNLLTSDLDTFLKKGMFAGKAASKIGARSGARAEGAHETLAQALGAKSAFAEKYLNAIGFTPAERGNRNTGAASGLYEGNKYAARLAKNPQDKLSIARLMREGINPEDVTGGALTQGQENRAALKRSNTAQFRSHPKDLPDWFTSNPATRTAALFKGFDYQQTRLILDETLGRLASGQPEDKARGIRNLGIVATVNPLIGEFVNDVYGIVSRKESPKRVVQRTKEFGHDAAQLVTGKMNPVDFASKYKARYGADMLAGSAPGTGGVLATTLQYGKGDKGGGIARQAVGPAFSRPAEAVQLAHDALTQKDSNGKDKPMTPAQKREALRLIFQGPGAMAGPWFYPDKNSAGQRGTP